MRLETITKRFACMLLAVVLAVPAVSVSVPADAAAKGPSLSATKKTVKAGSKFTIKVKAGKSKVLRTSWSMKPDSYLKIESQSKMSVKFYAYAVPSKVDVKVKVKYKLAGKTKTTTLTCKVNVYVKDNAKFNSNEAYFEFTLDNEVEPLQAPDRVDIDDPEKLIWDEETEMMAAVLPSDFAIRGSYKEVKIDKVVLFPDKKTMNVYVDPTTIEAGVQYMIFPISIKRVDGKDFGEDGQLYYATVDKVKLPAASGSAAAVA